MTIVLLGSSLLPLHFHSLQKILYSNVNSLPKRRCEFFSTYFTTCIRSSSSSLPKSSGKSSVSVSSRTFNENPFSSNVCEYLSPNPLPQVSKKS